LRAKGQFETYIRLDIAPDIRGR